MNVPTGVRPVRKDHRDRSYPATFGSVHHFPAELNLDFSGRVPDQNADGLPFGCTGYTQAEICGDQDQAFYQAKFTYDMTRLMEGNVGKDIGCDIRTSLKSTLVYGLLAEGETTPEQALTHRRGAYYNVVDKTELDAFDDVRSCLLKEQRSVSAATPWFAEWASLPSSGIAPMPAVLLSYHNYKIAGWKEIGGKPYLIAKPWQGQHYGDRGYVYFSREVFNAVMAMRGSGCFVVKRATKDDYATIKLATLDAILSYTRLWLIKLFSQAALQTAQNGPVAPAPAPQPPPVPEPAPAPVQDPSKGDKLYAAAYASLGRRKGLDTSIPKHVNCANAATHVMKDAGVPGLPKKGIAGTSALNDWLSRNPNFKLVAESRAGDIVIYPSGVDAPEIPGRPSIPNGHVFIAGKYQLMSNNSETGLWDHHWNSLREADDFYTRRGGLARFIYRWT